MLIRKDGINMALGVAPAPVVKPEAGSSSPDMVISQPGFPPECPGGGGDYELITFTVDCGIDILWVLRNLAKMTEDILIVFLNHFHLFNFSFFYF